MASSLRNVATVTPPAVSPKTPVVRASSRIPSTTSSSLTSSIAPPVRRTTSSAYGPSAGLPIAERLRDPARAHRLDDVVPGPERRRRPASSRSTAHRRPCTASASTRPSVAELPPGLVDLGQQRSRRDRDRPPAAAAASRAARRPRSRPSSSPRRRTAGR